MLSTFDVDNIANEALLFQTGYLTIRDVQEPLPGQWVYTLGYPNKEVESSLNASLLGAYGSEEHQALEQRLRLLELLQANDFGGLRELFHAFYASIPQTGTVRTNWPATKATTPASSTATSPR